MTLHEAIYQTLSRSNRPMTSREVADVINSRGLYQRKNNSAVTASQVKARISRYPEDFDYIQGEILLTSNSSWSDITRYYKYLQNLLRDIPRGDKSTLVVFLFFYKRISDLSERYSPEFRLPTPARINSLRNYSFHNDSKFVYQDLKYGIEYLTEEFRSLRTFFYQQYELVRSLDITIFSEILHILNSLDTAELEDRKFGRIFEYLIQKSFNTSRDGYYFTPQPVAELFSELIDSSYLTEVYDPCAGLGGLITEVNKQAGRNQVEYFASESNSRVLALGELNLILNGIRRYTYRNEDCLSNPFEKSFDLIVSDIPLMSKLNDNVDFSYLHRLGIPTPPRRSGTAAIILFILSQLKSGGRAYITVPDGFLYRKGFDEVARRYIIDNGLLEAVISLPAKILTPYTSAKVSILCLSSRDSHVVKFINGASGSEHFADASEGLNIDEIVNAYKWEHGETRISTIIPILSIRNNDYNLSVDQYNEIYRETGQLLAEGNAVYLESLAFVLSGTSSKNVIDRHEEGINVLVDDSKIRVIKAENLKKDIIDLKIHPNDVTNFVAWDGGVERSILKNKCLLIARIGDNPKPTIFDPQDFDYPIAIHRGVYALIPLSDSLISVEYLYYQFYSPFVMQQMTNSQIGSTIPHISIANLYKIVIPILDLNEQQSFVSTQRANLIQLERDKIEKRLELLGYEKEVADKESDIVRVLVHQLRPTFLSLNSQVETILRIVDKNKLEHFTEFTEAPDLSDPELLAIGIIPNKPANYSLQEICNKLLKDSKNISDKLTYVNKVMGFNLNKDDFQETPLKSFIQNHVKLLQVNNPLKFKIEVTGEECSVEFNKASMGELIDQLINNAEAHAFMESNGHNFLRFNIKTNRQTPIIAIEYSNNGKEFKLTLEQFISPFEKSQGSDGSGIGGYYIKRIVEAHKGTLMLNEKLKKGFALLIELPINQKMNSDE